jgi:hypothetical protein
MNLLFENQREKSETVSALMDAKIYIMIKMPDQEVRRTKIATAIEKALLCIKFTEIENA